MFGRLCSKICWTAPEPIKEAPTDVPARTTVMKSSWVSTAKTKVTISDQSTRGVSSKKESLTMLPSPAVVAKPLSRHTRKKSSTPQKQPTKIILGGPTSRPSAPNLLMDTDLETCQPPELELLREESKLYQDDYSSRSCLTLRFHSAGESTATRRTLGTVHPFRCRRGG